MVESLLRGVDGASDGQGGFHPFGDAAGVFNPEGLTETGDGGDSVRPEIETPVGETIGNSELLEMLGAGSTEVVDEARLTSLDRPVAMKLIRSGTLQRRGTA